MQRQIATIARDRPCPASVTARRAREAARLTARCRLCPHECGVDRRSQSGRCGVTIAATVFREGLLWAEELAITPSYGLFLAGCNLGCAFCWAGSCNAHPGDYAALDVEGVAARAAACQPAPASFSFIGGEPAVHLPAALAVMAALPPTLPVVWNSNFYFTPAVRPFLAGLVDLYVADLHFGNDGCAKEIADAPGYLEVVTGNLQWAAASGSLVVRHLMLPGHHECCTRPALTWLAEHLARAPLHLLDNYLPPEAGATRELRRELTASEAAAGFRLAASLGLELVE